MSLRERTRHGLGIIEPCLRQRPSLAMRKTLIFIVILFLFALVVAIAAYAASPIDLIPDFIPVVGYLDDLIIVPLGIALVIKLIPARNHG